MMRTLFLQAPSFDGFDGGAGSRYQARARSARSGTRPGSPSPPRWSRQQADRCAAAPAAASPMSSRGARFRSRRGAHLGAVVRLRRARHRGAEGGATRPQGRASSAPRSRSNRKAASRRRAAIDFVARNEFDFTIKEVAEGRDWSDIAGLLVSRRRRRASCTTPTRADAREHGRAAVRDAGVQARPRRSRTTSSAISSTRTSRSTPAAAASRAARSACGRRRSAATAIARAASATSSRKSRWAKKAFPQVKEFFFDDDTFTDDLPRAEAIAQRAGQARRHLVVQRQSERAARDARR